MKKDKLEKLILSHRQDLDQGEELDIDNMWQGFQKRSKPAIKMWRWVASAAAVAVILIATFVSLQSGGQSNSPDQLINNHLAQVDQGLADQHLNLVSMISQQDSMISILGISQDQYPELFEQLETMEILQTEMIQDLDQFQDRQNLIRALLRHYERKSRILEQLLYNYEKEKNYKNEDKIYL